ncbi:MAG: prepilin-type N-terminal cleavage/methylation domain-containing protein [Polyangiaceae bacterium]
MSRRSRPKSRGFTLVELMVAVTGGMFIALAVFALASDAGRFYKRESRVSDATLAGLVGFERLRVDLARAGFLGTPNVRQDPRLCGDPVTDPTWPQELKRMASVRIDLGASPANNTLAANGLSPDRVVLSGSYSSVDQFPIWNVQNTGANFVVFLQANIGPLARLGYAASLDQAALLNQIFMAGRGLRIQDVSGELQYGTIQSVVAGAVPQVILSQNPTLRFRQVAGNTCGLKGNVTGAVANVINFVQYDLRNLNSSSNFGAANPAYAPLYGDSVSADYDADRTDLVRVELDTSGTPLAGTEELVAEYAVDFKVGVTAITGLLNGTDPTLSSFAPGNAQITNWAGDITVNANANQGPHRLRALRARLSVRSREADREAAIIGASGTPIAPGLYRIGLGNAGGAPFARVRTLQADITLHNQMGLLW